ncbi:hypothetical protein GDO81_020633 [Engystomops pustulosus]|uniref:Uncharacterized protein n=2 Tax=Engystomops pustulosus TaxID=76066 RepID=A0AAV6ZEB4_ENGPU|nr:hypothetical protein GDO81_020633 [Engystomops pustulosus]
MTLLLMIWGLCLSILSLGYRVKSFCSSCKVGKTEVEEEALINPIAYDNVIIA